MAKYSIEEATLSAMADAIREKTQTSDAMTPEQMAEAIAALETGSGLPEGLTNLAVGSITPTSDITSNYAIKHGLGVRPQFGIFLFDKTSSTIDTVVYLFTLASKPASVYCMRVGTSATYSENREGVTKLSSSSFTISASSSRPLAAGSTYRWICGTFG